MRPIPAWLAAAVLLGLQFPTLSLAAEPKALSGIEFHQYSLVGTKLQLLVETYRQWDETLHRRATGDCKGYLLTIELASQEPFLDRARIIGPLWDVPNARSTISFDAGAEFTKEDTAARVATPTCFFDAAGNLIRILRVAKDQVVRDVLTVDGESAIWKRLGEVKPINDKLPPMRESRVLSPSRRYLLLFQDGQSTLFDRFTGEAVEDRWLTDRFTEIRTLPDFSNVHHYLTEDLKNLVAYPEGLWQNKQGQTVTTFQLDGKNYNREAFAFYYRRPETKAQLFGQVKNEYGRFAVFSSNDQLYMLSRDWKAARFCVKTLDRRFECFSPPFQPLLGWDEQPQPEAQEIVFLKTESVLNFKTWQDNYFATFARWNYKTNKLTQEILPIQTLFTTERGQYQPKRTIGIK